MEFLLFLLYPAGFAAIVSGLFVYLRKQETAQRAISVAKSHLTPAEDIEAGYKAVASSVKRLRAAKNEEQALLVESWEKEFYGPDGYRKVLDGRRHTKMLDDHTIKAKFIPAAQMKSVSAVVDDGPEWIPLGKSGKDPDTELSYSQRRIQRAGAFVRQAPSTSAATYGVAEGGSVVKFDGFVRAESVGGNDVWFVYFGMGSKLPKFVHSIATTNRSTSGLPDFTEYDNTTIRNGSGEIIQTIQMSTGQIDATKIVAGNVTITSDYLQLPNATIKSRQAENVKYDATPKVEIPSTITTVWY